MMRKSTKLAALIAAAAASVFGAHRASATIITQWAFTSVVAAPDNSPAPTTGTGTAVSLGMTNNYTYANGEGPGSTTNDDITTPGTNGEVAWRIRGNSNAKNAGPGNANGWNNAAPDYTQGAEFEVPTTGYNLTSLSFDWFATTQGVGNLQVLYTTDGSTWTPLGSDYIAASNNFYGASTPNITVDLTGLPAAASNDANFAVELVSVRPVSTDPNYLGPTDTNYASAAGGDYNNSSGNWSFNNITISGTAVPEPASASLLGLAGMALLSGRRRK